MSFVAFGLPWRSTIDVKQRAKDLSTLLPRAELGLYHKAKTTAPSLSALD